MATVEATSGKVRHLLTEAMGLPVAPSAGAYCVDFTDASTQVSITVREWLPAPDGTPQTLVVLEAVVLQGVRPTPALFEWVAREGGANPFGHIQAREDPHQPGTVSLLMTHTLLGDHLDRDELEAATWGVLFAADSWDDALQRRFGGRRAKDVAR